MEATALYRYVPGREQLLDGVVDYVTNELSRDAFADEFDDALHDLIKRVASFHS